MITIPESLKIKEKERGKLEKILASTSLKLANEEFKAKAPPHVVNKLEETLKTSIGLKFTEKNA